MSHPVFARVGLGLSIMLVSLGLNATIRPYAHLEALGFPIHKEPTAEKLSHALMHIWGIRNIYVGSLLTLIWYSGDEIMLARAMAGVIIFPVVDGFVSRLLIGGGELQHWSFPPILAVVAAGLYGYFD